MVSAPSERSDDVTPAAPHDTAVPAPSAWWVLIGGVIGLVASVALTMARIEILRDPSYVPSCNINPIVACGSVLATSEASLFGIPNSLMGIASFAVVVVTGVLALAKVPLPRWYWAGLAAGLLIGAGFVHWLIFQSLYRIGALCPYCMVVWVVTITLLVVVGSIVFRPVLQGRDSSPGMAMARLLFHWRWSITTLWFTAVFLLIMVRFWNYWSTLI